MRRAKLKAEPQGRKCRKILLAKRRKQTVRDYEGESRHFNKPPTDGGCKLQEKLSG